MLTKWLRREIGTDRPSFLILRMPWTMDAACIVDEVDILCPQRRFVTTLGQDVFGAWIFDQNHMDRSVGP